MFDRKIDPRGSLRSPLGVGRSGFTLIELLVVISIMAILATLTIAFFPNAASAQREARAAMLVQGWLNIAKQRALRDRVPFGLRLIQDPSPTFPGLLQVIECQYIQQPDDFTGGTVATKYVGLVPQLDTLVFPTGVDLLNGHLPINYAEQRFWSVQVGDSIELLGTGLVRQIPINGIITQNEIQVSPPLPYPIMVPTTSYRIIRSPRPAGEEKLSLPDSTIIDIQTNVTYNSPLPPTDPMAGSGFADILFGPSGQVVSRNVATANIHLWIRSPNQDFPTDAFRGDPTIISVFVRSGFIGAYPPDRSLTPYALVK